MNLAVELVSIAGVCKCTTVHYADVVKLNMRIKNRWGLVDLADSVGVALAGCVKVAPDEGRFE